MTYDGAMNEISRNDQAVSPEASLATSIFRTGVTAEQKASLAAGVPYPVMEHGKLVWVHPDSSRRSGMDPASDRID